MRDLHIRWGTISMQYTHQHMWMRMCPCIMWTLFMWIWTFAWSIEHFVGVVIVASISLYALRAALLWPNNAHCLRTRIYQTYQTDQLVSILVQCAAFSCQSVIKQNAIRNKQALFSDALWFACRAKYLQIIIVITLWAPFTHCTWMYTYTPHTHVQLWSCQAVARLPFNCLCRALSKDLITVILVHAKRLAPSPEQAPTPGPAHC